MTNTVTEDSPFGHHEEETIIALCFDYPEFFSSIIGRLDAKYFARPDTRYAFIIMEAIYQEHEVIPTREVVIDTAKKQLTADDDWKPILAVIEKKSDPREAPVVKQNLIEWAKSRAYAQLYSEEAMDAFEGGNYNLLDEIIDSANKLTDISGDGFWFFEDASINKLFEIDSTMHLTTGFPNLDELLNEGGPSQREVVVWVAPTGYGKSILLINNGAALIKTGKKVLHITMELSKEKTQLRYMGSILNEPLAFSSRKTKQDTIIKKLRGIRDKVGSNLVIYEFPADEISVDTVHQIVNYLAKSKGFVPDAIILDYLELMISKNPFDNREDYTRQKRVATQICGLAKKTNTLVFTASQTNRSGTTGGMESKSKDKVDKVIDLNHMAESYGKAMPVDYVITMNQTKDEYSKIDTQTLETAHKGKIRLYIAKNRNGPKHRQVRTVVDYLTMKMKQESFILGDK